METGGFTELSLERVTVVRTHEYYHPPGESPENFMGQTRVGYVR
ncbi:hypothetical protein PROAA_300004 [Candidatus Propionivibrio aalborgensis]|uniref:Uncharacterized protein n=1 Tax=Candidatus Propionivibrio aalborgensis TaxID=1860101 RepID=A0A1A8XVF9_9RHOO|nr:hypothetical protein PROAA_300004 [Candidatus Propionivibrio aalborgensis]